MVRMSTAAIAVATVLGLVACAGRTGRLVDASCRGDAAEVRRLLAAGARPEAARRDNGWTPLHIAAAEGHVEVVRILLDAGVPVDAPSSVKGMEGAAPLFFAAMHGRLDVMALLLDRSSDPRQVFEGRTPAQFAERDRQREAARLIRDRTGPSDGGRPQARN